jgi:hypothetical protein
MGFRGPIATKDASRDIQKQFLRIEMKWAGHPPFDFCCYFELTSTRNLYVLYLKNDKTGIIIGNGEK